ncbi:MAG TPA: DUF167 domain-containing protein [Candidatus Paceibacterota bacterium]|nr:DUF167 domain-containing protein [Candidatus Paceibacterota bacterium]
MNTLQGKIVTVKVSAGARTEAVKEIAPLTLRIRVQAPPEKGKANDRVAQLIADYYHISISRIFLVSGATSREKRFLIEE